MKVLDTRSGVKSNKLNKKFTLFCSEIYKDI